MVEEYDEKEEEKEEEEEEEGSPIKYRRPLAGPTAALASAQLGLARYQ